MTLEKLCFSRRRTGETAAAAAVLAFGLFAFSSADYGQTMSIPDTDNSVVAQASSTRRAAADDRAMVFETLIVRKEGAVLFVEIAAPPMNLLGPELVRDLVSLIQQAEADDASKFSCSRAPTQTISFPTST